MALALAAPAAGNTPAKETSTAIFGPFVDDVTCAFALTVEINRTRTTLVYANGDITRHTKLIVTSSANGKTIVSRNAFNVFIDADSPTQWVITGVFEKAQLQGRTLQLQTGRLSYDLEADEVTDPHPGPTRGTTGRLRSAGTRIPGRRSDIWDNDLVRGLSQTLSQPNSSHSARHPERKENVMRRLLTIIPLIGALALPATAAAVEPTRQTITFTTVAPRPCPNGVTLIGIFNATHQVTTFYDNDGTPVRELTVITFEATTTNPLTGQSLPGRGMRIFHRDLITGEFFTTGNNVVTKLPDGGVAIGGAGRLVFDPQGRLIEHHGPDSESERQQLCAALGA